MDVSKWLWQTFKHFYLKYSITVDIENPGKITFWRFLKNTLHAEISYKNHQDSLLLLSKCNVFLHKNYYVEIGV